jgi:hypothetical protein
LTSRIPARAQVCDHLTKRGVPCDGGVALRVIHGVRLREWRAGPSVLQPPSLAALREAKRFTALNARFAQRLVLPYVPVTDDFILALDGSFVDE